MSAGKEWLRPVSVTRSFETAPAMPDTRIIDGYGVASLIALIVIGYVSIPARGG
jgi:hypothetical protein